MSIYFIHLSIYSALQNHHCKVCSYYSGLDIYLHTAALILLCPSIYLFIYLYIYSAVSDFHLSISPLEEPEFPLIFPQVTTCKQEGKKLLEIESQEENDIMSELLFHASKLNNVMDHVSTGRGHITCGVKTVMLGLDWGCGLEHRPCKRLLLAQRN